MKATLPHNEEARLSALHEYRILDTLPEECYDDITLLAAEICNTPISLVSLIDEDRQWFKSRHGIDASETTRDVAFCAHAIVDGEVLIVPDATFDPRFTDNPLVQSDPHIRFYAGAPLVTANGESLGTLCVIDRVKRTLTDDQINSLRALSRQVMAQLELRRHVFTLEQYKNSLVETNEKLEEAVICDDVSGFHNTRFLHRYLDNLISRTTPSNKISLVFLDMDKFKLVVDTYGHQMGSKVLREVAQLIHTFLGPDDRIVRYGGDEFVVILPDQSLVEASEKVEVLKDQISAAKFLEGEGLCVTVTASFGLATYPDQATGKDELLKRADDCLFRSKANGRNCLTM